MALPIFRSTPAFDVGMPVALAIFCLICVMPKARFHEKLSPGIGVDFFGLLYLLVCDSCHLCYLSWLYNPKYKIKTGFCMSLWQLLKM